MQSNRSLTGGNNVRNETIRHLLAAVIIALIMGVVGSMVMDDEQKAQEQYCKMVADGLWPAYRKDEVDCE